MTKTVGKNAHQDSVELHVRGTAQYIDDMPEPADCLHIAPGHAKIGAKGRISKLDLSAVEKADGVVKVLTAKSINGSNDCSPSDGKDPIFADQTIEFHGQVVFAVVATSHLAARKAASLATIEIDQETPAVYVCDGLETGERVQPDYHWEKPEAETAIAATLKNTLEMEIGGQEHFYLEGQAAMALPLEDGGIHIHSSNQHPTEVQHLIAHMLKLPSAKVVSECRRMGGGFGGKESQGAQWACIAALGANLTGRACKMRLDRDDDMRMTGKRHDFFATVAYGHDEKGKIEGTQFELNGRCGVSTDLSIGVMDRTMFHADNAYFYPAVDIRSKRVKTDTVSNTAFRGFGGPQGVLLAETLIDKIAIETGQDPLAVRKRNLYASGRDTTPYGMKVKEASEMKQIITALEKSSDYKKRRKEIAAFNKKSPYLKKGIALTPVKFGISFTLKHMNQAGALVHVYADGSVSVNHGGTEMGQGLYTKVAQVVAETLGINLYQVGITATRTDKVPNTFPTAASAGSDLNGMAAQNAAKTIKERMAKVAARLQKTTPKQVIFEDESVFIEGKKVYSFAELAQICVLERVSLSSTGYYATPGITWDRMSKTGNPFYYFALGAACSEVIVDTLTGENRVTRVDVIHDVGKSLNPEIDKGQIEGGFVQGMGWLTTEELVYKPTGELWTHAPSTYKIPTAFDVPEHFNVELWASKGNHMPTVFRSKAVGEPPVMLAVSVFSAINQAIASIKPGVVPKLNAPATPEAILKAVSGMET
ncbi:MAG: xanthine dehydrogenase molybdopterin binding subunit [Alphaproteobacteria bacterium]